MTTNSTGKYWVEIVKAGGETARERRANAIGAARDLLSEAGVAHAQAAFRPSVGWSVKIVRKAVR